MDHKLKQNTFITVKEQQFFFRQQACYENSAENTFFVARDVIKRDKKTQELKTVKQYTSFPSYEAYISWEKQFEPKNRNFYEQIKDNSPCWEYYDIDDWADKSITPKQLYNDFLDHRIAFGLEEGINSERSKFTVLDSSKYNSDGELIKGSLHILSNNVSFPNNQQHNEFFKKFVAYLPSEFPKLDKAVYSKNRVFRLENNTKIEEYRPLKKPLWLIETGMFHKPIQYLITVNVDPSLYWTLDQQTINERQRIKEERQIALEKLPRVDGQETIFEDIVSYIKEGKHPKGDERFNCALLGYADWIKFTYAVKGALGMNFVEKHWDEIYYLYGNASESCCQSQLTSIMNKEIEPDNTSFMWWAKPLPKFQEEYPEHCNALNSIKLPTKFRYEECKKINIHGFESVSYVDLLNNHDTVFVRGNMGCGKTEKLSTVFPLYKKIVFISSKRSLAYDFKNKHPDFELYDDQVLKENIQIDLDIHNKVIIQIDSLNRLFGKVDLLVVDEYVDLSSQIQNSNNRREAIDAFQVHLEFSSKRLIMDANLDRIDYFKLLIDMNKACFVVDTKRYHTDKHIYTYTDTYLEEALEGYDEKKRAENFQNAKFTKHQFTINLLKVSQGRLYVPSDSKKFIISASKLYKDKYPHRRVLVLTSKSSRTERREDWKNYDVIFCSPTITAGVSHKDKIDHVYAFYTKRSISAWAATQQLLRCRNWEEAHIYFGTFGGQLEIPVDDDEIEKYIDKRFLTEITDFDGLKINRIKKCVEQNFSYYMYLEDMKRANRSKMFFKHYFIKIMLEHGIRSTQIKKLDLDREACEKIVLRQKDISDKSKEELVEAITKAQPTEVDIKNFKSRNFDMIDEATLECILMTETYGFCPKTTEEVKTYMNKRKQYRNICCTVQQKDVQYELADDNYSTLDIKDQNDIQRRMLCNSLLRAAGFNDLLDKKTILLSDKLGEFVRENTDKIQVIFNSYKEVTLDDNRALMNFVNSKLRDVYGISITGREKQKNKVRFQVHSITGMNIWSEVPGEGKPCITDKIKPLLMV